MDQWTGCPGCPIRQVGGGGCCPTQIPSHCFAAPIAAAHCAPPIQVMSDIALSESGAWEEVKNKACSTNWCAIARPSRLCFRAQLSRPASHCPPHCSAQGSGWLRRCRCPASDWEGHWRPLRAREQAARRCCACHCHILSGPPLLTAPASGQIHFGAFRVLGIDRKGGRTRYVTAGVTLKACAKVLV